MDKRIEWNAILDFSGDEPSSQEKTVSDGNASTDAFLCPRTGRRLLLPYDELISLSKAEKYPAEEEERKEMTLNSPPHRDGPEKQQWDSCICPRTGRRLLLPVEELLSLDKNGCNPLNGMGTHSSAFVPYAKQMYARAGWPVQHLHNGDYNSWMQTEDNAIVDDANDGPSEDYWVLDV